MFINYFMLFKPISVFQKATKMPHNKTFILSYVVCFVVKEDEDIDNINNNKKKQHL